MTIAQTTPTPIPDNVRLSGVIQRRYGIKAPRTTAEIASHYARTQRLTEAEIGAPVPEGKQPSHARSITERTLRDLKVDHADRFLAHAVWRWLESTCRSDDSRRAYLAGFVRWITWYGRQAWSLSGQCGMIEVDVVNFLRFLESERGLSVRSVVHAREILSSWFRFLWDLHLMDRMPIGREAKRSWRIRQERIVRGNGTRQALSLEQARLVVRWALHDTDPAKGFAVLLQMVSGLRSFEVVSCDRKHLTITDHVQTLEVVGKGQKARTVMLEPVVVTAWQRYSAQSRLRGDRGYLIGHNRQRYDRDTVQTWAKEALRVAGRPDLSSHDLRRTAATLLMDDGATLEAVRDVLGHSSANTTERCYVARKQPLKATTRLSEL